jgi:hypothetical protein
MRLAGEGAKEPRSAGSVSTPMMTVDPAFLKKQSDRCRSLAE